MYNKGGREFYYTKGKHSLLAQTRFRYSSVVLVVGDITSCCYFKFITGFILIEQVLFSYLQLIEQRLVIPLIIWQSLGLIFIAILFIIIITMNQGSSQPLDRRPLSFVLVYHLDFRMERREVYCHQNTRWSVYCKTECPSPHSGFRRCVRAGK